MKKNPLIVLAVLVVLAALYVGKIYGVCYSSGKFITDSELIEISLADEEKFLSKKYSNLFQSIDVSVDSSSVDRSQNSLDKVLLFYISFVHLLYSFDLEGKTISRSSILSVNSCGTVVEEFRMEIR